MQLYVYIYKFTTAKNPKAMHDFNSVENYLICRVSLLSDFTDRDNDKIKNKIIRLDNNHMMLRICCVKIDCI